MNKKAEKYHSAEEWCHNVVKNGGDILFDVQLFDNEISKASEELGYPVESLNSFLRNVHLKHVKKKGSILRNSARHLIQKYYMKGMTIQNLAKKINSPPSMVARAIVEHLTNLNGSATNRRKVTEAIRDPIGKLNCPTIISEEYRDSENVTAINTTIRDNFSGRKILKTDQSQITRLAREVIEATNCDPLYGPRFDKERNFIGVEYEIVLERTLRRMGIPFETEDELRERGTARTPDILFSCPVAIRTSTRNDEEHDWKMICWIDSKVSLLHPSLNVNHSYGQLYRRMLKIE